MGANGDLLDQLPEQPDRCRRSARVLRPPGRPRGRARLPSRRGRGVHRALVRVGAALGASGGRPLARRRVPNAEQTFVDDRLPLGVRGRPAGVDLRAPSIPAHGRDGPAGIRPARLGGRYPGRSSLTESSVNA